MSNYIMNEKPLHLLPTLALKVGFKEALILQYLKDCLDNDPQSMSFKEKRWVRKTYEDWQKNLPFWSVDTIKRIISSLEEQNLILSSKIRESQFDHGKWYTINDFNFKDIKTKPSFKEKDKYRENLINSEKHPLWIMACEDLLIQTEDLTLKKWLCEMDIITLTGSTVHLSIPNQIIKNWIINNVYRTLIEALEKVAGYSIEKLYLEVPILHTFGAPLAPELEEEGKTPPTNLSSSTPHLTRNSFPLTGVSS